MSWSRIRDDDGLLEWERDDGHATLRVRERADGSWVVRLDRLTQASEGSLYRQETRETRADALDLVEAWRGEYDHSTDAPNE